MSHYTALLDANVLDATYCLVTRGIAAKFNR